MSACACNTACAIDALLQLNRLQVCGTTGQDSLPITEVDAVGIYGARQEQQRAAIQVAYERQIRSPTVTANSVDLGSLSASATQCSYDADGHEQVCERSNAEPYLALKPWPDAPTSPARIAISLQVAVRKLAALDQQLHVAHLVVRHQGREGSAASP